MSNSFALTSVRIIAERRSQLQPSVRARSKLRNTTGPDAPNEPRRTAFLMLGTNSRGREAQARCLPRRSAGNCISGIPKLIELPIVVSRCLDRSQYLYALLAGAARHHREAAKRREEDRHIEASDDSRSANEPSAGLRLFPYCPCKFPYICSFVSPYTVKSFRLKKMWMGLEMPVMQAE